MLANHQVNAFRAYLAATPERARSGPGFAAFLRRSTAGAYDSRYWSPVFGSDDAPEHERGGEALVRHGRGAPLAPKPRGENVGREEASLNTADRRRSSPVFGVVDDQDQHPVLGTEDPDAERQQQGKDDDDDDGEAYSKLSELVSEALGHNSDAAGKIMAAIERVMGARTRQHEDELEREEHKHGLHQFLRGEGLSDADCAEALKMASRMAGDAYARVTAADTKRARKAARRRAREQFALDALAVGQTRAALGQLGELGRRSQDAVFSAIVGAPVRTFSDKQTRSFEERFGCKAVRIV